MGENFCNPSDKVLISRIYKELKQIYKKKNKPIQKWAKDMNRHFPKNIYVTNKHEKTQTITGHYRNANQNYDDIPSQRIWKNRNAFTLLVGV